MKKKKTKKVKKTIKTPKVIGGKGDEDMIISRKFI